MYVEQQLQLDHDDHDRTRYRGLAHKLCNLRAGAIKGNRQRARKRAYIKAATAGRW
jgi:hypothetical protein